MFTGYSQPNGGSMTLHSRIAFCVATTAKADQFLTVAGNSAKLSNDPIFHFSFSMLFFKQTRLFFWGSSVINRVPDSKPWHLDRRHQFLHDA